MDPTLVLVPWLISVRQKHPPIKSFLDIFNKSKCLSVPPPKVRNRLGWNIQGPILVFIEKIYNYFGRGYLDASWGVAAHRNKYTFKTKNIHTTYIHNDNKCLFIMITNVVYVSVMFNYEEAKLIILCDIRFTFLCNKP